MTDSVPEERVGTILGFVMLGFSCGQAIGPPVGASGLAHEDLISQLTYACRTGGVLYARMGYRAPFVFSLALIGVDLLLRLFIIEKHVALKYIRAGHYIPDFEAPGYVDPTQTIDSQKTVAISPVAGSDNKDALVTPGGSARPTEGDGDGSWARDAGDDTADDAEKAGSGGVQSKIPSHWIGLWHMLSSPRAMTTCVLTLLNGFIVGALQDTGLTLYLETQYHQTSFGAGLIFLGFVIPTFFVSLSSYAWRYGC